MSNFNAAQVLAEAYTLYKKHHDGMGLDFKIAIAEVRKESEQRGAEHHLRLAASELNMHHLTEDLSDDALELGVRFINLIQDRADRIGGKICGLDGCESDEIAGHMQDGTLICYDCAREGEMEGGE